MNTKKSGLCFFFFFFLWLYVKNEFKKVQSDLRCTVMDTFILFTLCRVNKLSNCTHFDSITTFPRPAQGSESLGQYYMNPAETQDFVAEVDFLAQVTL